MEFRVIPLRGESVFHDGGDLLGCPGGVLEEVGGFSEFGRPGNGGAGKSTHSRGKGVRARGKPAYRVGGRLGYTEVREPVDEEVGEVGGVELAFLHEELGYGLDPSRRLGDVVVG